MLLIRDRPRAVFFCCHLKPGRPPQLQTLAEQSTSILGGSQRLNHTRLVLLHELLHVVTHHCIVETP
jgi:hypothetical protein